MRSSNERIGLVHVGRLRKLGDSVLLVGIVLLVYNLVTFAASNWSF